MLTLSYFLYVQTEVKELEARINEAQNNLQSARVSQARLSVSNGTLRTRIQTGNSNASNISNSAVDTTSTQQPCAAPLTARLTRCQQLNHGSVDSDSSIVDTSPAVRCSLGYTKCGCTRTPRPLESYTHTASVGNEHILPHMPHSNQQSHPRTHKPDHSTSSISFADVSLVRDALECHRRHVLASMEALPEDTAWYLLYTYEVRPGLRLSHSTTMGSPACHLSAVLAFWAMVLDRTFLKVLEDRHLTVHPSRDPNGPEIQELGAVCRSVTQKAPCLGAAGGGRSAPKPPETPLLVPTPQLQALQRYGVMCGENRRVQIIEAVRTVLRAVMLRYHQQLPMEEWGPVCMQSMHAMCKGVLGDWPTLANVETVGSGAHSTLHAQDAGMLDECPWGELQSVAGESVKLMVATMQETYLQCNACDSGAIREGCPSPCASQEMTHTSVVERAQALNIEGALSAHLLLTDAPAAHRIMTELPRSSALDISWVCIHTSCDSASLLGLAAQCF